MSRAGTFQNSATGVVVLCALVVTGLVARRELVTPPVVGGASGGIIQPLDAQVAAQLHASGQVLGPTNAHLRIVEFVDLECPFCAVAHVRVQQLLRTFDEPVAVVIRHFPLQKIHPHAFKAALAAECAGEQGRFEPFVETVYSLQDSLGALGMEDIGARVVPRKEELMECLQEARFTARVNDDIAAGTGIGVRGTPTFVVGNHMYMGDPSSPEFRDLIREAMKGIK